MPAQTSRDGPPALVLGPLLRYVDGESATVWVETDRPCTVDVLGRTAETFTVQGRCYAIVAVTGLEPGSATPYEVRLDGVRVWPYQGSPFPPSLIRTLPAEVGQPSAPLRVALGSCQKPAPHDPPYTGPKTRNGPGMGVDALRALGMEMLRQPAATWPSLLVLAGDQVYADQPSVRLRGRIRARRGRRPPADQVADFVEYAWLYGEMWGDPVQRWTMSTLPTAMIFDDHDIHDDWNTSASWRRDMAATSWWADRITAGLASYWVYQHLGNLSPAALASDETLAAATATSAAGGDAWPVLAELARVADAEADGGFGVRWSYARTYGGVRLVVADSRCARVLLEGRRAMLSPLSWEYVDADLTGDVDHLLLVTSMPVFLPDAIHDLEQWDAAVAARAWGRWAARPAESLRRALDLEHWAAFPSSFEALVDSLAAVGAGLRGRAPASVVVASGDVHHHYLTEITWPREYQVKSAVYQVISSPIRNPGGLHLAAIERLAWRRPTRWVGQALRRSVGLAAPTASWRVAEGPWWDNGLAILHYSGSRAHLSFQQAKPQLRLDDPSLETVWAGDIAREPYPLRERPGDGDEWAPGRSRPT